MAQYSENFSGSQGHLMCPLCLFHLDCQAGSFSCPVVKNKVVINGKYLNIFTTRIKPELAETLVNIYKFRADYIESRKIK